jgi:ubiquitin carboxyl-terminal hydrolase 20/33
MVNGDDEDEEETNKVLKCDDCTIKQNLWLCLRGDCLYVGCGQNNNSNKHSMHHASIAHHPLSINLSTKLVWCEICQDKIDLAWNNPPFYFKPTRTNNSNRSGTLTESSNRVSMGEENGDDTELANFLNRDSVLIVRESKSDNSAELAARVGQLGLANLGNTCYMNAALQAMSNCYIFTSYFLECSQYIQLIQLLKNPNGSQIDKQEFFSTSVSYNYMKLMRQLWLENVTRATRDVSSITPNELLYAVKSINPMFRGYQQHDSQEFLIFLIEQIHEELKRPRFELKPKNSEENKSQQRMPVSASGESFASCEENRPSISMSKSTTSISTTTSQITDEEDSADTYETCDEEEFNRNKSIQAEKENRTQGKINKTSLSFLKLRSVNRSQKFQVVLVLF